MNTYLYLYESDDNTSIYIGIGTGMSRVWENHNPEAERLRDAPGTRVLQTIEPFRSRDDARKAEAIAIHVAALSGRRVIHIDDTSDGSKTEVVTDAGLLVTNIAGRGHTSVLGPAIHQQDGTTLYSTLRTTALVAVSPDQIDERPPLHSGLPVARFAERAEKYWPLGTAARCGYDVRRLVAVLKTRHTVLGDWDVEPTRPFVRLDGGRSWRFNLVDPTADDPRGKKGMRLIFDTDYRLPQSVGYSSDVREHRR